MTGSVDPATPRGTTSGLRAILLATVVAGVAGYLIQVLAPIRLQDPHDYLTFSVFWSTLYLAFAAVSGIQQEVARATSPAESGPRVRRRLLLGFSLVVAVAALVVIAATGVLWGPALFLSGSVAPAVTALAFGIASYLLVAVLSGIFSGIRAWARIAAITAVDAALRVILVGMALLIDLPVELLLWAVVAPLPAALLIVWLSSQHILRRGYTLDTGFGRLSWNTLRTVVGAAATGLLISGLPVLIRLSSEAVDPSLVAAAVLALTLTRTPLIIPLLALQSFLVVQFRDGGSSRRIWLLGGSALLGVTGIGALAIWAWGPWLIGLIFGKAFALPGWALAVIFASAGLTAALCVTGPAVLARGRHGAFTGGWLAAAATLCLVLLAVPGDFLTVLCIAVVAAPLVGITGHLNVLRRGSPAASAEPAD